MNDRIYVCHTYYHAYVAFLKELDLRRGKEKSAAGEATLVLSSMSNDFEQFGERVRSTGLFADVIPFDEKREDYFPELASFREDKGNIVFNMWQRIRFTRCYAKLEAPFIPVDFRKYREIYVFCDSDPIGYYLNQNKIYYHAMEDGLNCLVHFDAARYDNRGHFGLKAFLSKKLNLIFVQNGYGKYCLDMEVNSISAIALPCPYYKEVPRQPLVDALTKEDKDIILHAFVRDMDGLLQKIEECNKTGEQKRDKILVLTDPLCTLDVREQIFKDIVEEYEKQGQIFIKPHPRDVLDYRKVFPDYPMFDATMPMEMLNFFPDLHFEQVVTVFTDLKGIRFADQCIRLGGDFMDKYEDHEIHSQNKMIGITENDDGDSL
ncbi:MAG: lipooligosaccharide sialyltransferase [Lachnospiraceae bacterium]|nr:lipooligosaccharide sialyltransferase [Lachnospiraceae bacterium]